ncbi:MAG: HAD family phosphatase [Oscillospiraceae bacterium]|nr:HAD family phosphatase [Oscillospiraceae bacterium]
MNYRLMAVDMDGTLLNSENQITPVTEAAIKQAMEKGLKFTLCTGRPLQGVLRYVEQLQLDCPIITYNGAMIVHSGSGEVLFSQNMDSDEARRVWDIADKAGMAVFVWSAGELFARAPGEKVAFYEEITKTKAKEIVDFEELVQRGVTKLLWYDEPKSLDGWVDDLKGAGFEKTTFTKSRAYFLEFFSAYTSKAVAMEKLGEYYGIDKSEMIAVGDQTNDLPMIEYAGLGVAMGNAVDAVKAVAGYITDTNENDGVAKVIEKFIG